MSEEWIIEAKRFPISGGIAGHLYFEIWKPDGTRFAQINGLATDRVTGIPNAVGGLEDQIKLWTNDIIPTFSNPFHILNSGVSQSTNMHDGMIIFSGSEQDIISAFLQIESMKEFFNAQDYDYSLLSFNSNSVFSGVAKVLEDVLNIDPQILEDAKDLGPTISSNPGKNTDIFKDGEWSPNIDKDGNIIGTTFSNTGFGTNLTDTPGDDIYIGSDKEETFTYKNGGSDIFIGKGSDDEYLVSAERLSSFEILRIEEIVGEGTDIIKIIGNSVNPEDIQVIKLRDVDGNEKIYLIIGEPRLEEVDGVSVVTEYPPIIELDVTPQNPTGNIEGLDFNGDMNIQLDDLPNWSNGKNIESFDELIDQISLSATSPQTNEQLEDILNIDDFSAIKVLPGNQWIDDQTITFNNGTELFFSNQVEVFFNDLGDMPEYTVIDFSPDQAELEIIFDNTSDTILDTPNNDIFIYDTNFFGTAPVPGHKPISDPSDGTDGLVGENMLFVDSSILTGTFGYQVLIGGIGGDDLSPGRGVSGSSDGFLADIFGALDDIFLGLSNSLGSALSAAVSDLTSIFLGGNFLTNIDPIVLDLDGDGIELISFEDSSVVFDVDNDGFIENTGWVSADDALLVHDINNDGIINDITETISEYYNSGNYTDGFEALRTLDSNDDSKFDSSDTLFSTLKIWQDLNEDGITDTGELVSLSDAGIQSIDLSDEKLTRTELAGNPIFSRSTFVINNIEQNVASVDFTTNPLGYEWNDIAEGLHIRTQDDRASSVLIQDTDGAVIDLSVLNNDANITNDALSVIGNIGDDVIWGDIGDNWLVGGTGNDSMYGGLGNDFLFIDAEDDLEKIDAGDGLDTVFVTGTQGMMINLAELNAEVAVGGDHRDVLIGGGSTNVFVRAGAGNDVLIGGSADDILSGEDGEDILDGGLGNDVLRGHRDNDIIIGNNGNDFLDGGLGNDMLYGGLGDDLIISGGGHDKVDGGSGYDVAQFSGDYKDYTISTLNDGRIQVSDNRLDRDGVNILNNIEALNFNNLDEILLSHENPFTNNDIVDISGLNTHIILADELLGNDFDLQGGSLSISSISDVTGGVAIINGNGDISFTPDASFGGVRSFKYSIQDQDGNNGLTILDIGSGTTGEIKGSVFLREDHHPDDALFYDQWYVNDINLLPVWQDYSGEGVNVGIFEHGSFDINHSDLSNNVTSNSKDSDGFFEVSNHATLVAGVIASEDNGLGTIGVAHDANIDPFGMQWGPFFYLGAVDMFVAHDVVNNSWGATIEAGFFNNFNGEMNDADLVAAIGEDGVSQLSDVPFSVLNKMPALVYDRLANESAQITNEQAIKNAAFLGRSGLGTVVVFAAGNDRAEGWSSNVDNLTNNEYTITVGAINRQADVSSLESITTPFSNPGSNILISASGSNLSLQPHVFENSNGSTFGNEAQIVQGTSFATPIVSGIAALMLEANPDLGWRDVQDILAYSARLVDDQNTIWQTNGATNWNGGGLHFSHDYGYGNVDALAAVRLAETWGTQNTNHNVWLSKNTSNINQSILDNATFTDIIQVTDSVPLEYVTLTLDIVHDQIGDLIVTLTSPDGTDSVILDRLGQGLNDASNSGHGAEDMVFSFGSRAHLGEVSEGTWTLEITDAAAGSIGTLRSWSLDFTGKAPQHTPGSLPPENDLYLYTNEYADLTDSARQTLSDNDYGDDIINVAAITGDVTLNLNAGSTSFLDGKMLTISTGSIIERAYTGDGNDILTGNQHNNLLYSGRGDDQIDGGLGNDWLFGKSGINQLTGGAGNDRFVVDDSDNGVTTITDFTQGDTLVITNSNDLLQLSDLNIVELNGDSTVAISNEYSVVLQGVSLASLNANDFMFDSSFEHRLVRLEEFHGVSGDDNESVGNTFLDYAMYGYDGNDILTGSFGNDTIWGGLGNDTLNGAPDNSLSYGGEDYLYGEGGDDTLYGGGGRDYLDGGTGSDQIYAGLGNDVIYLDGSFDQIFSEGGNNTFIIRKSLSTVTSSDLIHDFDVSFDRIDLTAFTHIESIEDFTYEYITTSSGIRLVEVNLNDDNNVQDFVLKGFADESSLTNGNFIFAQTMLPKAYKDEYTLSEDGSYSFSAADLLLNDTDPNNSQIDFVKLLNAPSFGTLSDDGNGNFVYTPDVNYTGLDELSYEITNTAGDTATSKIVFDITTENDAPYFELNDLVSKKTGKTFIVNLEALDVDGDYLEYSVTQSDGSTLPAWMSFNSDTLLLTGDAPLNPESVDLNVSVFDGHLTVDFAFTLNIETRAPMSVNDGYSLDEDMMVTSDVLTNDSDADGDTLSVSIATTAVNGTLVVNGDNTITYTPNADYNGLDSYTYTVNDGKGGLDTATVNLTINAVNDAPIAQDDILTGDQDTDITGNIFADNSNGVDNDVDGDTLIVAAGTFATTNGSITLQTNGDFVYSPNSSYVGADSFIYTVNDGNGGSDTASLNLTLNSVNTDQPPTPVDGTIILDDASFSVYPFGNTSAPVQDVSDNGYVVTFEGDTARKMAHKYIITENTILEFDVNADDGVSSFGIGIDKDSYAGNNDVRFRLDGSDLFGWNSDYNNQYTTADEWQHYSLSVGDYFDGDINYLTFFSNDLVNGSGAQTLFANVRLYEQEVSQIVVMDDTNFSSYGYNQDQAHDQTLSSDGLEVTLTGNTWRKYAVSTEVTPDTVLEFEFKSTVEGDSQGIGIDTDNLYAFQEKYFQLNGTDSPAKGWYPQYDNYQGAGDWQQYSIRLGDFYDGDVNYLTFINEQDGVSAPDAESAYRNIRFYDDPAEGSIRFNANIFSSYGYNQDTTKDQTISNYDRTVELTGDAWRKMAHFYTITEDTVLEFDFKSTVEGQRQGIGIDTENNFAFGETFFELNGTSQTSWLHHPASYEENGDWQHFQIRVGDYYTGGINYLTFINGNDADPLASDSSYSNVRLYELSDNETVVLKPELFDDYGYGEDVTNTQVLSDDGNQITLEGDAWRSMEYDYTVTAQTILEFDFRVTDAAAWHGIGLDTSRTSFQYNSNELFFELYGPNTTYGLWNKDYEHYDGSGEWQHFSINLGDYHQGAFDYLTFVSQHDAANTDPDVGESSFSNIRIYESSQSDDVYNGNLLDNVITAGDGDDILIGASGSDTLDGALGDDILYGQDGLDTLIGGLGADTFVFETSSAFDNVDTISDFNISEGDTLDLTALLSGYDATQDAINDFIEITEVGTDSVVSVDTDGGADAFVQIATLQGVTGLADENALETAGNLITA